MGRQTDLGTIGSRRAAVATLTASALLVAAGIAIVRYAGDVRLGPSEPPASVTTTQTTPATPTTAPAPDPAVTSAPHPTRGPTASG